MNAWILLHDRQIQVSKKTTTTYQHPSKLSRLCEANYDDLQLHAHAGCENISNVPALYN